VNINSDYLSKNTSKAYGASDQIDYYPFGMERSNTNQTSGGPFNSGTNPYLYNGKEIDRMNGLNENDYGGRWYDAAIGRWGSVDPLAEKDYSVSPYAYCAGNPMIFIDKDGKVKIKASVSFDITSGIIGVAAKVFGLEVQAQYSDGVKNGFKIYSEFDTKTKEFKIGVSRTNKLVKGHELAIGPYSTTKTKEKIIKGSGDLNTKDRFTSTKNDEKFNENEEAGGFGPIKSNEKSEIVNIDLTSEVKANAGLVGVELKGGIEITDIPTENLNNNNKKK
jgi:RHS repeat-associated protein